MHEQNAGPVSVTVEEEEDDEADHEEGTLPPANGQVFLTGRTSGTPPSSTTLQPAEMPLGTTLEEVRGGGLGFGSEGRLSECFLQILLWDQNYSQIECRFPMGGNLDAKCTPHSKITYRNSTYSSSVNGYPTSNINHMYHMYIKKNQQQMKYTKVDPYAYAYWSANTEVFFGLHTSPRPQFV
jgi:hypothetical protein